MTKAWAKERQWECSKAEQKFEELLHQHDYKIVGYREYMSKTDMMICKNDVVVEWSVPHIQYLDVKAMFAGFEDVYNLTVKYQQLVQSKEV